MIDIRLPNITATTERGQLEQIRSYLYQFAQQLNYALNNLDGKAAEIAQKAEASSQQKNSVEQAQATFSEVKSLIIKSADIVNAYYEEINHRLEGVYVAEASFPEGSAKFIQETSASLKANSESISIMFENNQAIITDMEGLATSVNQATSDVADMEQRVSDMSESVENVSAEVAGMGGRVSGVEDSVENASASVAGLDNRVGGVEKTVSDASKKIDDEIESFKGKMESIDESIEGVNGTLGTLSGDVNTAKANLETINGALTTDGKYTTIICTDAWCRVGEVGKDGDYPIYGIEVGQTVNKDGVKVDHKFAQYRSDGVFLYGDNPEVPVATISGYAIKITNAVIHENLTIGGYEVTTKNGLAFKWIRG